MTRFLCIIFLILLTAMLFLFSFEKPPEDYLGEVHHGRAECQK